MSNQEPTIRERLLTICDAKTPPVQDCYRVIAAMRDEAKLALDELDRCRISTIERYELGPHYRLVLDRLPESHRG